MLEGRMALGLERRMEMSMTGRIPAGVARLAIATLALTGALATAGAAGAGAEVIYSNAASPLPGNVVSEAFEATQTGQFGGAVEFAGTARKATSISVVMSSWGCESGSWTGTPECKTTPGAKFKWPITLDINEIGPENSVGPLIASSTKTFGIPYRPSQNNKKCTGEAAGAWYDAASKECFHGKAVTLSFAVGRVTLPSRAILSIAYDTSDYGTEPQRSKSPACEPNCGYDSLNVGLTEPVNPESPAPVAPSVGTDPLPEDVFQNTDYAPYYCDGGAGGTGVFRLDAGCWTGYQPLFTVKAQ
jgi:hypothetical protein